MCNYYLHGLRHWIPKTEDGNIITMSTLQIVRIVDLESLVCQTGESTREAPCIQMNGFEIHPIWFESDSKTVRQLDPQGSSYHKELFSHRILIS